ncbi:NADH-quinone oxidoreductase subunit NuoG [Thiobacter aerophilum]|uniref:NADH-quinone oxidoreductase n=1 Tax=Thiobacter aerophilum TaxID=3121275 RepID=A0ABV0EJC2_9BURK
MLTIEIDGKKIEVPEGSTVMDAADRLGIYVPRFCYHRKLSVAANCRMCLVDVEKAPKPLPACATPVTDGMKVSTRSDKAIRAQKGVMEFLLINHPLDCPICDQGGECQLQDLAVGFGAGTSRYREEKRVVVNKNLGPLIATDMTRCIHCTRCVRFGQEIAGQMELGQAFRGEHSEIMPFVAETVDSELSGNMIDLCPVGALTSKPFRYTARPWELSRRAGVSPHDGLGANLLIQVKKDRVMRVLPRENEAVNECWLADRDRFSYQALNSETRLLRPLVKHHGAWIEVDWQAALEYVANGLREIVGQHGPDAMGALAAPNATLEELHLLQKLVRGLGCDNVDHRLRHSDFRADDYRLGAPWLGQPIEAVQGAQAILLVGSNIRKEQPLLAHRVRQAVKHRGRLHVINPLDVDMLCPVAHKLIVPPPALVQTLAQVVKAAAARKGVALAAGFADKLAGLCVDAQAQALADSLCQAEMPCILLGNLAQHHPRAAELASLAAELARITGARWGVMAEAANSVGAYLAGALPHAGGRHAAAMLKEPRRVYLLLHAEPELDSYDPQTARAALAQADLVVALSSFRDQALEYAHVILPVAAFAETAGTYVNMEGRVQSFAAAVKPPGEARPAWKVLRVLGNLLNLPGFDQDSAEAVRQEVLGANAALPLPLDNAFSTPVLDDPAPQAMDLARIGEVPIYQLDALTRRAPALQATRDARPPLARLHPRLFACLGLKPGDMLVLRQGTGQATLPAAADPAVPEGCVHVAAAHPLTLGLAGMFDPITVERA